MSSLPLISHHLFVAAIEERPEARSVEDCDQNQVLEMELVDCSEQIPELLAHPRQEL